MHSFCGNLDFNGNSHLARIWKAGQQFPIGFPLESNGNFFDGARLVYFTAFTKSSEAQVRACLTCRPRIGKSDAFARTPGERHTVWLKWQLRWLYFITDGTSETLHISISAMLFAHQISLDWKISFAIFQKNWFTNFLLQFSKKLSIYFMISHAQTHPSVSNRKLRLTRGNFH